MDLDKIGKFIALNRKNKGLTQEQLAEKLGVTNKTVSRWETGKYMPDLSLLKPLSEELGITLNELLSGEKIEEQKIVENMEKNIINTIDYSNKKVENEHKKISIILMILGAIISISALTIFDKESSWCSIYSIIGIIILVMGLVREIKKFKKIVEYLYNELGILIKLSNNIKTNLKSSDIIVNIDFPEEIVNKLEIPTDAIILNIPQNININLKKFAGINIKSWETEIPSKYKLEGFNEMTMYEASMYEQQDSKIFKQIQNDDIKIRRLIGINGIINTKEFGYHSKLLP